MVGLGRRVFDRPPVERTWRGGEVVTRPEGNRSDEDEAGRVTEGLRTEPKTVSNYLETKETPRSPETFPKSGKTQKDLSKKPREGGYTSYPKSDSTHTLFTPGGEER